MTKVLIFAPHPDDDLIGCGGSIAKHVKQGNEVAIVYLTSGDAGSLKYAKKQLAEIREKEAGNAAKIIGVKDLIFLKNPDGYLECNKENLVKIVDLIREKKPNIIYIPHKSDAHKDHMKTYELVAESIGRASSPLFQECKGEPWSVDIVLCYEVWTPLQEISYIENIDEFIDLKIQALEQHKSQIQDMRYDEAVKGLNRYRGIMTGKGKYCECFQVLKINKI
ncbi:MAG: PIG-L family deacetylase [Candidatus Nanoarchaeia archaeon]|jgi:LmbE family N-acetylglucosaminyl deacetylase